MINENIKKRIEGVTILGTQILDLMNQLVIVAEQAGAPDAAMLLGYADTVNDNLQPGEFTAEIHLVVKRVAEERPINV